MNSKFLFRLFCTCLVINSTSFALSSKDEGQLQNAYRLFQAGKYEEAISQFQKAARVEDLSGAAYRGLGKVYLQTGQYAEAEKALQKALSAAPQNPLALALLGDVFKQTGRLREAKSNYDKALTLAPDNLYARLRSGIYQWEFETKPEARKTLQYFINYYRSHAKLSGEETSLVAEACIYLERFRDANTLFNEATNLDKSLWQAYIPWGNLFLLKYNDPDAIGVFEDALKINPNAAEAHLGLAKGLLKTNYEAALREADKALEINPNYVAAHDFLAELNIASNEYDLALERLRSALQINPKSLESRTLKAVCYFLQDKTAKFQAEEKALLDINPNYGELYYQIGEVLARRYLFKESAAYYRKALTLDRDHWLAHAGLGTSLSRLGKEKEANEELEKAFKTDPYNKYVGNLLTLFDAFPQYKTHRTSEYILRIHEKDDPVLAGYAQELIKQCLADLHQRYDFDSTQPVTIEIFPEHDDFAVRCFGIPGAQAFLGICFGNVVAMDSPRARTKGDFVWGETLWHELVHVTHLRMTENRIPRWLAEGIAVYETTRSHPFWDMNQDIPFLAALQNGRLLPIKELDSGFNRPTSPGQVTLSYYQASKIVEYIVETFGQPKLLATFPEFKAGAKTPQVIETVFGKNIDAFDRDFRDFIRQKYHVDNLDLSFDIKNALVESANLEKFLKEKIVEKPNNPFLNFQLGMYYKKEGNFDLAIPYLTKAKELFPKFVQHENPYKLLSEIYLEKGLKDKAIAELRQLTALNGKDLQALKKLANLSSEAQQSDWAIAALQKAIYIAPYDSDVHKKLGEAYVSDQKYDQAIREFQVLLLTDSQDLAGAYYELANAYFLAGRKTEAKESALAALEIAPGFEKAQEILLKCLE
ncbi:MAG: tetratricopeptide repeat protein [bacterium]